MLAAQCNCHDTAKVLLEYGANVDVRDSENKTVLHYAIGSSDIVKEILKVRARRAFVCIELYFLVHFHF